MQKLAQRALERAHELTAPPPSSARREWVSTPIPRTPPPDAAPPAPFSNMSRSRQTASYTTELIDLKKDEIAAEAARLDDARLELARERRRMEAAAAELKHAHHELTVAMPHKAAARLQVWDDLRIQY